jgi:hypothetical protein
MCSANLSDVLWCRASEAIVLDLFEPAVGGNKASTLLRTMCNASNGVANATAAGRVTKEKRLTRLRFLPAATSGCQPSDRWDDQAVGAGPATMKRL